jgi:fatty acid/phospholipid biosynthesis enzyme
MKIKKKFLEKNSACSGGMEWVIENNLIGLSDVYFINELIKNDKLEWANWLIVRVMKYKQYVSYAIYAAEQVIDIYEKKYPDNKKPREAIESAKKCLISPSKKNKAIAAKASESASMASAMAFVNSDTSSAVASATAMNAASAAAYSKIYAEESVNNATLVSDMPKKMRIKILKHGLKLLSN